MEHNAVTDGSQLIQDLTDDRQSMWHSFTKATLSAIIFMAVLLIGMAVFLL